MSTPSKSVAIIGSGPAGCFAAAALLKSFPDVSIDVFDKLFSPYGLVRSGVAPDHSKIKSVQTLFDKTLSDPRCRFFGNIDIGSDISMRELREHYSAVLLTHGAESDRRLGIPGEDLRGSHTATEFVGWYNCNPNFREQNFDLHAARSVAIIGQGNVAVDVARILAKPVNSLASSDIGTHAVESLARSAVTDIYVIGRRGPVQAAFTDKELKELGEISGCDIVVDRGGLELSDVDRRELEEGDKIKRSNLSILSDFSEKPLTGAAKRLHLLFLRSPVEIGGGERVSSLKLERNLLAGEAGNQRAVGSGEFEELSVDLVLRSVGYKGTGIEGVPFDSQRGVYRHDKGRILNEGDERIPNLYCAGWIKRGPSGVIGTNKACSVETVTSMVEDGLSPVSGDIDAVIKAKGLRVVTLPEWQKLDAEERRRGEVRGKERERFLSNDEALAFLGG